MASGCEEKKTAVIMAGGKGTRLMPYTMVIPKPLVPVGQYPIMEIVIRQLASYGFERVIIAVNHQAELIETYFGNGSKFGLDIEYSLETKPLSTMGPLKQMQDLPEHFLVMNSDVLTDLDYSLLLSEHIKSGRIFTISSFKRVQNVEYGVLHEQGGVLSDFTEKPKLDYLVSMGVYALSKRVLDYIPYDEFFGFDNLMKCLLENHEEVGLRLHEGYWLDIGRPDDYQMATDEFESKRDLFLKKEI
ncbi:MAG: NTP transferase domain-containing protein [Lachnospiraceae bacterium]|nr:NTP transferase domain-containing protein [Lachnospiraceae bacterium]